ncbi:MAG: hypothetical protein LBL86_10870 [Coriobacteriales bacterium]|jgi:hypothetical protein|nr:hypothetical protein [Coriobacteriales bacterium]
MDGAVTAMDMTGFQDRALDKVERLLGVLEELGRHPALKGKLCMHGGTAINILMLDVPRLSELLRCRNNSDYSDFSLIPRLWQSA